MATEAFRHAHRRGLAHLYIRQHFDNTRTFVLYDGSSWVGCPCFYCGNPATTEDHAYPLVALQQIYGLTDLPPSRLLVIVPACQECNGILGNKVFSTLSKRKQHIKKRLRERYRKLLAIPEWGTADLGRLGRVMQEYVILGLRQQELLQERLCW